MVMYVGERRVCPILKVALGVSENIMSEIVAGEGQIDITELQQIETQVQNCLNP